MPTVQMHVDYMKKRPQSVNLFDTLRNKTQFTVSPVRFKFERFNHVSLGVIHPEPAPREINEGKGTIQKAAIYYPGDLKYIQVDGSKCPINIGDPSDLNNKKVKLIDQHLLQPFFYIQKLFPRGREPKETYLEHPDVFIDFTTLPESKRNNKNLLSGDYKKILKAMNKQERANFYAASINMNIQYAIIFKRFIKSLIEQGLMKKNYKMAIKAPKIPINAIENMCEDMNLIQRICEKGKCLNRIVRDKKKSIFPKLVKEYDQLYITKSNFVKLLKTIKYDQEVLEGDVNILFNNVLLGDLPIKPIQRQDNREDEISLAAFLYNVQKFMKLKYKIKNIFSINAAKTRNAFIKQSLLNYIKDGWKILKRCLQTLSQCENRSQIVESDHLKLIQERDQLIQLKRIWAKNLMKTEIFRQLTVDSYYQQQQYQQQQYQQQQSHTQKQLEEYKVFKSFLDEFYNFSVTHLQMPEDRLKNVRKEWEWNIIGEWLLKKLKKLDQNIEYCLGKSVGILKLKHPINQAQIEEVLNSDQHLSVEQFIDEDFQNDLYFQLNDNRIESSQIKSTQFIKNYTQLATQIQQTVQMNKNLHPVEQFEIQSIGELIDKKEELVYQPQSQPAPQIQEIVQHQEIKKNKKERKKKEIRMESPQNDTISRNATMTESELDAKIKMAYEKQGRILSTLAKIKDYPSLYF